MLSCLPSKRGLGSAAATRYHPPLRAWNVLVLMSTAAPRAMKLLDIIRPESIVVPLAAGTKHEAIDALAPFGPEADVFRALARYIMERDR